jgi:hypothetical protein
MGFLRFRRSVRVLPGIRLNFGRRSTSVSIGVRGAHVTFGGSQGTRTTIGIPGSGLSYTEVSKPHHISEALPAAPATDTDIPKGKAWRGWLWIVLMMAVAVWWWRA